MCHVVGACDGICAARIPAQSLRIALCYYFLIMTLLQQFGSPAKVLAAHACVGDTAKLQLLAGAIDKILPQLQRSRFAIFFLWQLALLLLALCIAFL